MVGGRRAGARGILLFAGSAALASPADAGAWAVGEGVQQWFATISRETGDFGEAWRADDFVELGLGGGWAVNAKIESQIRISDLYDDRSAFRLGVQKAFALNDRASFSFQASLLGGEAMEGLECQDSGYEARAAIGTSFSLFGREGFVNAEAGPRVRDGGCERTVAEIATGLEFAPDWNPTLKAWSEQGRGTRSAKAEAGLSRDFGPFSVGAGWREGISGEFEEKGWVVSAQARF